MALAPILSIPSVSAPPLPGADRCKAYETVESPTGTFAEAASAMMPWMNGTLREPMGHGDGRRRCLIGPLPRIIAAEKAGPRGNPTGDMNSAEAHRRPAA